jgi:hypothetical protein
MTALEHHLDEYLPASPDAGPTPGWATLQPAQVDQYSGHETASWTLLKAPAGESSKTD